LGALGVCACGGEPEAAAPAKTWHVVDGFVRAPDGRRAILRGANLAGAHKSSPYFGFHQPTDYTSLKTDWGMNTIRFLVLWAGVEPEKGSYDEAYLDGLAERVGWARDAGLFVVLDMHQDVFGEGFNGDGAPRWACDEARYAAFKPASQWFLNYLDPNVAACIDGFYASEELLEHYTEAWRRVANKLVDNDAVVGFDPMNEPQWGSAIPATFEVTKLQPFYERIVPAVREIAPHWLAFLEPGASRNIGMATQLVPFPFGDVVYSPHCYDSAAEQGNGFDPAARGALINKIAALAGEAASLSAALWIGEYGGRTGSPGIGAYMDANYDGAAAVAAPNVYWSYDRNTDGYGMLNDDGSAKTVLLDALVRPVPELVAGDPIRWDYDEQTRTFSFQWQPDPHVHAPTVVSVPSRVYPNGYDVQCGGCVTEKKPGELFVTLRAAGEAAKLVISAR
jgi:endoglycosylceramidase